MRRLLGIPLLAVQLCCHSGSADEAATSARVSEASLLADERFWPYQVALAKNDSVGVLIRVEEGGVARIDFGRDGLRDVPIADTDLVERANLVRSGGLDKQMANFVLAIGPRLVDSSAPTLQAFPIEATAGKSGFLCVFADPSAADFAQIAKALSPLGGRDGAATLLFPQGRLPDELLREKLQSLGWTVPFVYDHLSESYTRTLLSAAVTPPAVMLVTKEGRVLLEGAWRDALVPDLTAALDAAFAPH